MIQLNLTTIWKPFSQYIYAFENLLPYIFWAVYFGSCVVAAVGEIYV